jgi:hypothetical protein
MSTNPSILNRHRQRLPYKNLRIATVLSLSFPSECSLIPLMAPPCLRLSIQKLPNELEREQTLNLVSVSLQSTSIIIYHISIALLTVSQHKMGVTRINQKVDLNATRVSTSSYRLSAQSKIEQKVKV